MAGGDVAGPREHKGKGKKRRKGRRLGTRIDMTPLVDVAFLLLTFFMFTTSMSRPQTMEINLPPEKATVEVAQSNLLTIRVKEDGTIYWNIADQPPVKVEYKDLRKLMTTQMAANPKLITLIKVDRKGKYHMMVDIMDEMNMANIQRFSLAPMLDADKAILAKIPG